MAGLSPNKLLNIHIRDCHSYEQCWERAAIVRDLLKSRSFDFPEWCEVTWLDESQAHLLNHLRRNNDTSRGFNCLDIWVPGTTDEICIDRYTATVAAGLAQSSNYPAGAIVIFNRGGGGGP